MELGETGGGRICKGSKHAHPRVGGLLLFCAGGFAEVSAHGWSEDQA